MHCMTLIPCPVLFTLPLQAALGRAAAAMQMNRAKQALEDAQLVQQLRPADARGVVAEGLAHMANSDFSEALDSFRWAMRLDKDYKGGVLAAQLCARGWGRVSPKGEGGRWLQALALVRCVRHVTRALVLLPSPLAQYTFEAARMCCWRCRHLQAGEGCHRSQMEAARGRSQDVCRSCHQRCTQCVDRRDPHFVICVGFFMIVLSL